MRIDVLLKILMLIVMLSGVVFVSTRMNEDAASKFFHSFGIEPGTSDSPGLQPASNRPLAQDESRLNVCKTRVRAVVWPDGRKVEESRQDLKARWLAVDPTPREIGALEVEKWFSRHCQIVITEVPAALKPGSLQNFLTFEFIDGTKLDFQRTQDGHFVSEGRLYRSPDFDSAVAELIAIAQLQPVGP